MAIELSDHFSYKRLLKFVLPTVIMMIFTSLYGLVDGLFVANFVGSEAFTAVNLMMPVIMAYAAVGFMVGTGGSALVSKVMGEGDGNRANAYFSMLIIVLVVFGLLLTGVAEGTLYYVAVFLKAEGTLLDACLVYGRICLGGVLPLMLQDAFQSFFVTAEKPRLGLYVIVAAGVTNVVLDALFVAILRLGIAGAAAATVAGQCIGGLVPLGYFLCKNGSRLRIRAVRVEFKPVLKACANGASEMLTNLSLSFVNIMYDYQLMRLIGNSGVNAYGFIMYVNYVFLSIFIGYSIGVAPIVGYNYGAKNQDELKDLLKKSLLLIAIFAAVMLALALTLNRPLAGLFVGEEDLELTYHAFFIYSFALLMVGFNIFTSAFFTALNNGVVSAALSFLRIFAFQIIGVFVLPLLFGVEGIWYSILLSEFLGLTCSTLCLAFNRKKYGY